MQHLIMQHKPVAHQINLWTTDILLHNKFREDITPNKINPKLMSTYSIGKEKRTGEEGVAVHLT